MITDVGVDMDGVIYDFAKVFHEYAQNRMGKELPLPNKWDFYKDWGMSDEQFDEWLTEGVQKLRLFNCDAPMENTVEGWNLLKQHGIKIHVLTHRGHISYEQTVQWLNRFGLYPDSLHFGNNKAILGIIAKDECAAIDDYTLYYEQYEKANILSFLRTQPWNGEKYARRVTDLLDFAEKVIMLNNAKRALIELPNLKSQITKPARELSLNYKDQKTFTTSATPYKEGTSNHWEYYTDGKSNDKPTKQ